MTTPRRPALLAGLDPGLAGHVANALVGYSRHVVAQGREVPDGLTELIAAALRVAKSGQLRAVVARMPDDRRRGLRHEQLLGVGDAASVLRISTRSVRRRVADGSIPVVRIGRRVLIDARDLLDYLERSA